jgi:hypothetical protein
LSFSFSAEGLFTITFLLAVEALDRIDVDDVDLFTVLPGASPPFPDVVVPAVFPLGVVPARDAATELAVDVTDAVELFLDRVMLGTGGTGGFVLILDAAVDAAVGLTLRLDAVLAVLAILARLSIDSGAVLNVDDAALLVLTVDTGRVAEDPGLDPGLDGGLDADATLEDALAVGLNVDRGAAGARGGIVFVAAGPEFVLSTAPAVLAPAPPEVAPPLTLFRIVLA